MDQTLIGSTVVKLMDELPEELGEEEAEHEIIAVAIVVIAKHAEKGEYVRVASSEEHYYQQVGILHSGISLLDCGWGEK